LGVLRGIDKNGEEELDKTITKLYTESVDAKLAEALHIPINRNLS